MEILSHQKMFGGEQIVAKHLSEVCGCDMTFAIYLPPAAQNGPVPVLWFLSGLGCTHENAMVKSGAQMAASEAGLAVVFPDTSPRGDTVPDDESYDLGQGAGFYVDATEAPWATHYQMWSYVKDELPRLIVAEFPIDGSRQGITGHSMGGHGALTLAMSDPGQFKSCTAISPIAHPATSGWGRKQLGAYLGEDEGLWEAHDATLLMQRVGYPGLIMIDQGQADQFLDLLEPNALANAAGERRQPITFRMRDGYDHSYFFVASVMSEHVWFHAEQLGNLPG